MNLTSLIEATRTRLGVPASDAFYTDQNITDLVNAAMEYISAQYDFYWLEQAESLSVTAGTESVATAAASQRTIALYDTTGIQLEYRPFHELVRFPADAESNVLRFFGYRGATLILRPVPLSTAAGALTHVYRGSEPRLLTGTDTPLMPPQFHDAIADKATNLAHLRQGDLQSAKSFHDLCQEWITVMIAHSDRFADSMGGGARSEGEAG